MRSALYECEVVHQRLAPKRHGFRYRLFYLDLDLDEVGEVARRIRLFSHNRRNLFEFRDSDHAGSGAGGARCNLAAFLAAEGIELSADMRVRLITLPRIAGYVFNPVSFYFVTGADGRALHAVAEVGNTFGEQKLFLLREPDADGRFRLVAPKHFYVSPFTGLEASFDFRLGVPGERLEFHIDDLEDGRRTLVSVLRGKRAAFTNRRLCWFALKYPLLTLRVIAGIHWHALLLWAKRVPFHRKASGRELQTGVIRPHSSLTDS